VPSSRNLYYKEATMSKVINCECGEVVRGRSDEELIEAARAHIARDHPQLLEQLKPEDILGMAEEED
jgi:hypothetical protein